MSVVSHPCCAVATRKLAGTCVQCILGACILVFTTDWGYSRKVMIEKKKKIQLRKPHPNSPPWVHFQDFGVPQTVIAGQDRRFRCMFCRLFANLPGMSGGRGTVEGNA